MNIGFWDNQLTERGTTTSLYDYAYYNEVLLGNKSFIFYNCNLKSEDNIIKKFEEKFTVHSVNKFDQVDEFISKYNITHIYIIKSGEDNSQLSKIAKNCIHCVFNCYNPHGDIYASISPWIRGNDGKFPCVPHMIDLPEDNNNIRNDLGIPQDAIVFGGYGGKTSFNIDFAKTAVHNVALNNPNIYFLFANFDKFCDLPNVIFLPTIYSKIDKVKFINSCDAMLWARREGETFGISIGEFSSKNKPIIAMQTGDLCHYFLLGDNCFWYHDYNSLEKILLNFQNNVEKYRFHDWNMFRCFTPQNVMQIFKKIFLD